METLKEKPFSRHQKGFSLIELLVAITIFIIVIGAITSMFVSAIKIQRYVLASQYLLDQSSYAMEYTSKVLRMAKKDLTGVSGCIPQFTNYAWDTVPGETSDGLLFEKELATAPPSLICKGFFLEDSQLKDYEPGRGVLPLTSANRLEVLDFGVAGFGWGQPPADTLQARVTMTLGIRALGNEPQPKIRLQTTISQRDLDLKEVEP